MTHIDPLQDLLGGQPAAPSVPHGAVGPSTAQGSRHPAKGTDGPIPAVLHEIELGQLFGMSASQVRYLAKEGIAVRAKPAHYIVRPTVANYIARLSARAKKAGNPKGDAPLAAEKLRKERAAADKIELANAKARGDMVDSAAVEREWANVLRDVRSALLAIPSRIGSTLPHLTAHDVAQIDSEIKAALEGLADGD